MTSTSQNDSAKREMAVLFAINDPQIQTAISAAIAHVLNKDHTLKLTIKEHERDVREAALLYDYDLIVLYVNLLSYEGNGMIRFDRALELIRELKQTNPTPILLMSSFYPRGFVTAADQAGVEAILDTPFTMQIMEEQIRGALERYSKGKGAETKVAKVKRRQKTMRPRVVMLDDSPEVLAMLSDVVRSLWEKATIVACTDSYAAWEELQHRPPDLLITDLIHGGIDGFQLLARLAEHEATYPIVVLSGNLPEKETEAREAAGENLRVSYWGKPTDVAEFGAEIKRLLEGNL